MTDGNVFSGCEDNFFAQAESDYERQRKEIISKASCSLEKKRLFVSSDRYLNTLDQMQVKAGEAEQKISGMFDRVLGSLSADADEIQRQADRALRVIKKQALRTEKIVRLTSKEHRVKFVTLIASAFFGGIVMTVFVYHAFITGIMNRYLHHTIEVMAQTEINEAKKEADLILRNANIKADGILRNADSFANKNNDSSLETGGKE